MLINWYSCILSDYYKRIPITYYVYDAGPAWALPTYSGWTQSAYNALPKTSVCGQYVYDAGTAPCNIIIHKFYIA